MVVVMSFRFGLTAVVTVQAWRLAPSNLTSVPTAAFGTAMIPSTLRILLVVMSFLVSETLLMVLLTLVRSSPLVGHLWIWIALALFTAIEIMVTSGLGWSPLPRRIRRHFGCQISLRIVSLFSAIATRISLGLEVRFRICHDDSVFTWA